ncbi:hypothetical protein [Nocardia bovistercoris]|uniref:Uncharacterized protein n=1 Tax=Nocardia bovistercoris TaxID=2785916 RepID=A0A931N6F6_9NOCA|nr:hypothetical protein [Nocardia bovistercoris]MBH0780456.1 hypothetical protein [Nocardia bovistercoris]
MENKLASVSGRRAGIAVAILLALVVVWCVTVETIWPGIAFGVIAVARLIALFRPRRARPSSTPTPDADRRQGN